jgi:hypothetical protein
VCKKIKQLFKQHFTDGKSFEKNLFYLGLYYLFGAVCGCLRVFVGV